MMNKLKFSKTILTTSSRNYNIYKYSFHTNHMINNIILIYQDLRDYNI